MGGSQYGRKARIVLDYTMPASSYSCGTFIKKLWTC